MTFNSVEISDTLATIIYACFMPACALLFMLFLIPRNHLFSKEQNRLFLWTAVINIFMMFITASDFVLSFETFEFAWILRQVTSFFNFAFAPILPLMLFRIFVQKKSHFYIYIPFLVNILICISSLFTNIVFSINRENQYARGTLFFVPFSITLFYILLLTLYPTKANRRNKTAERILMIGIMISICCSILFELIFRMSIMNYGVCAMGLCVFYIMQNVNYFTSDPLTGAFNRQMYQHVLSRLEKSKGCVFALIDINDFKEVNDTYGHAAGDKVLVDFVEILTNCTNRVGKLYRIGGDEFMLIATKANPEDLRKAIEKAQLDLEEKNVEFAFGMGMYSPKDNIQEVLGEVDKDMYRVKSEMKSSGNAEVDSSNQ